MNGLNLKTLVVKCGERFDCLDVLVEENVLVHVKIAIGKKRVDVYPTHKMFFHHRVSLHQKRQENIEEKAIEKNRVRILTHSQNKTKEFVRRPCHLRWRVQTSDRPSSFQTWS